MSTEEAKDLLRAPDDADTRSRVTAWAEANPLILFDIAAAISDAGGSWPAEAVTRAAQETAGGVKAAAPADVRAAFEPR